MTLTEAIERVREGDFKVALVVENHCRFVMGMTRRDVMERVTKQWPDVTEADWDALIQEAEEQSNL